MVFAEQQPTEYEVEFLNADGGTLALLTVPEHALQKEGG